MAYGMIDVAGAWGRLPPTLYLVQGAGTGGRVSAGFRHTGGTEGGGVRPTPSTELF